MTFKVEINVKELQKKKLFIATPMYGGVCSGMFTRSMTDLTALATKYGLALQIYFLFNESLITRARNYCCDEFMRSDATHMLFIDSDISFNPNDVIGMLAMQMQNPDYHILGAPYPKKTISWEKIKLAVDKGAADENPNKLENFVGDYVFNPVSNGKTSIKIGEPAEVLEIGTGFMMFPRETLEKFNKAYPNYTYKPDHVRTASFDGSREIMMYFQAEVDIPNPENALLPILDEVAAGKLDTEAVKNKLEEYHKKREASSKRYLSEDYWFCQRTKDIGIKTWLCPWMQLKHIGSYIFGGSLADLASIGASATADPNALKKKTPVK
jgi:hypothetical protein